MTPQTPPAFIALSDNDEVVPVRNSILYYDALKENGRTGRTARLSDRRHGWIGRFDYWDEYRAALLRWLGQVREGKLTE